MRRLRAKSRTGLLCKLKEAFTRGCPRNAEAATSKIGLKMSFETTQAARKCKAELLPVAKLSYHVSFC